MATYVYGVLGWLVQSLERTDYHTGSKRIGRCSSRSFGARFHQSLHVPWRYKLWLHEWLLGSRNFGSATSTSYDYDALLDEEGNPTAKYLAVKKMMATHFPEYPQLDPLYKESMELDAIPLVEKVSLFETLDSLSSPVESLYPKRWRS